MRSELPRKHCVGGGPPLIRRIRASFPPRGKPTGFPALPQAGAAESSGSLRAKTAAIPVKHPAFMV